MAGSININSDFDIDGQIEADSIIKRNGTGSDILLDDGSTTPVSNLLNDADNGLSLSGRKVQLGGSLGKTTLLNTTSYTFSLYNSSAGGLLVAGGSKTHSQGFGSAIFGHGDASGFLLSGFNAFSDKVEMVSANGKGIEYDADYSSTFVNRSLVDKEYVDTEISSAASGVDTNGTPVIGQIATFFDADTIEGSNNLTYDGDILSVVAEKFTLYKSASNSNPFLEVGADEFEAFKIQAIYNSGTSTLDRVEFRTTTSSTSTDDGRILFIVDSVEKACFHDDRLELKQDLYLRADDKVLFDSDSDAFSFIAHDEANDYGKGINRMIYASHSGVGHHFINGEDEGYEDIYSNNAYLSGTAPSLLTQEDTLNIAAGGSSSTGAGIEIDDNTGLITISNADFVVEDVLKVGGANGIEFIDDSSSVNTIKSKANSLQLKNPSGTATIFFEVATGLVLALGGFQGDGSLVTNVDADTLDGVAKTEFLRSNAADTKTSGDLLFNNNIKLKFGTDSDMRIYNDGSGTSVISLFNDDLEIWDGTTSRFTFGRTTGDLSITGTFSGDGSLLTDVDADTLDGIDSLSFVRSDVLDTITATHYYEATQVIKDANRIDFGTGNDMRIYHSSNQNYIDVHNGDIKVRDGGAGTTKFTFDISEGEFISTGAIELSGYLGLGGGTFTDADDVFTDLGMTGNGDITIGNNTTGSTNFPTEFGQSLLVHGASDARDFGIYKATIGDFAFHLGQKDSSSNWEWSEIIHADNRNNRDWETAGGDTAASNGADTWARVADYNIDTNFGGGTIDYEVNTNSSGNVSDANLTVFIRRNGGSGLVDVSVRLSAINSNSANMMLDYDSFKIIANSATDIQLWINKKQNYGRVSGRVTGKSLITTTETYYTDAAWQASEPTGSLDNDTTSSITTGNNDKIFHQGLATFNYDGDFTSNKFIMDGKTSDDILLGDGTTTSLSAIPTGDYLASDGNDTFDGSSGTGITFEDSTFIKFGTGGDAEFTYDGSGDYLELNLSQGSNFKLTEDVTTYLETDFGREEIDIYCDIQIGNSGTTSWKIFSDGGFSKPGFDNDDYLMASGGTRTAKEGVNFFMVKANTVGQTTTTSNTTLAGMWDTPNITDSAFTFTPSTGELEIEADGMCEIQATLTGYQSGGDRHQLSAYVYVNGSRYAGTTNYASRNNTQRSGGVTISALVDASAGDIITIRVKHLGQASIIGRSLLPDETFITAKLWQG